jgi:hypothetical protein
LLLNLLSPAGNLWAIYAMDYEYFANKIGSKFSLVRGQFVENPQGEFTASFNFAQYSIYLNKQTKTWAPIAPEKSYLARNYILKKSDCITLFTEWLDDHIGTTFGNIYNTISNREFIRYYKSGMRLWYEDNGFKEVNTPEPSDCLVYGDSINTIIPTNHVGVCVSYNKILHHLPGRFSSIDTIEHSKIIGCYRYD